MSAERELLRKAKCLLECSNMEPLQRQSDWIIGEIKELLEQPEQAEIAHGNVFSDLGFDPVEAAELQANSNRIISKKLDQSQPEQEPVVTTKQFIKVGKWYEKYVAFIWLGW